MRELWTNRRTHTIKKVTGKPKPQQIERRNTRSPMQICRSDFSSSSMVTSQVNRWAEKVRTSIFSGSSAFWDPGCTIGLLLVFLSPCAKCLKVISKSLHVPKWRERREGRSLRRRSGEPKTTRQPGCLCRPFCVLAVNLPLSLGPPRPALASNGNSLPCGKSIVADDGKVFFFPFSFKACCILSLLSVCFCGACKQRGRCTRA